MWSAWLTRSVSGRVPAESRGRSESESEVSHELTRQSCETKTWWAGTGLNRRHQDFQSYSLVEVRVNACCRKTESRRHRALECSGMTRNALELGTVWAQTTSAPIGSPHPPVPRATAGWSARG